MLGVEELDDPLDEPPEPELEVEPPLLPLEPLPLDDAVELDAEEDDEDDDEAPELDEEDELLEPESFFTEP